MRLAQIARKVGLTPVEIKRFLEREFEIEIGNEPNYKLDDNQINSVLEAYPIPEDVIETPEVEKNIIVEENPGESAEINTVETVLESEDPTTEETPLSTESDEDNSEEHIVNETIIEESETVVETETDADANNSTSVEINYDEPLEDNNSEDAFIEVPVDPDAELIKAPKIKLDGLKVLGKIELPDTKKEEVIEKTPEEIKQEEAEAIADLDAAMQLNAQDIKPAKVKIKEPKETEAHIAAEEETFSEYKDKRGIYHFSHQQKINREKALIRIEARKKLEREKEKKKRHYEELMKDRKPKSTENISKSKQKKIEIKKQKREEKAQESPTTLWGKFMRWLND